VPPDVVHGEEADGLVEVGCRGSTLGWYTILQFDPQSKRLVRSVRFVNKNGMPMELVKEVHGDREITDRRRWDIQKEWARVFYVMTFGDHQELGRGIVVPRRVETTHPDGSPSNVYQLRKIEIDKPLPDGWSRLTIPDGVHVVDLSLDPLGDRGQPPAMIEYEQDSTRSVLDWKELLDREIPKALEILQEREQPNQ
jgi:hypothetical protein